MDYSKYKVTVTLDVMLLEQLTINPYPVMAFISRTDPCRFFISRLQNCTDEGIYLSVVDRGEASTTSYTLLSRTTPAGFFGGDIITMVFINISITTRLNCSVGRRRKVERFWKNIYLILHFVQIWGKFWSVCFRISQKIGRNVPSVLHTWWFL